MDHNQRTSKNRSQDSYKQAKKVEESQKSRQTVSGMQSSVPSSTMAGGPDIQFVNAAVFRQQFGGVTAVHKGAASLAAGPVPTHVKIQRGSNLYHTGIPGQVMMLKTEKEKTPSPLGDPPPPPSHTTKSSSLSRDISPSRITAQVVSAMSESTQPLLLSALTGKMPAPLMMGAAGRPDATQELKQKQLDMTAMRSSPYNMAEQRHSPVNVDGRAQAEIQEVKMRSKQAGLPFENLMRAAAMAQAQELHAGSGHHQTTVQQLHAPGNHPHSENRNQTPSPKPVPSARSPQRHGTQQGQRRSPVGPGSRSSPAPSHNQEVLAAMSAAPTMSGGVLIQMQPRGLVQQHLLAGTIATTNTTHSSLMKAGPGFNTHSVQHSTIPAAPSAPTVTQSTIKLSTIPIDMTVPAASLKGKNVKNSHGVSIGTGTELKQYASQGAQTKNIPNTQEAVKVKPDEIVGTHAFQPHRKEGVSQIRDAGVRSQTVSGAGFVNLSVPSSGLEVNRVSPVMSTKVASHGASGGVSFPSAISSSRAFPVPSSAVLELSRSQTDIVAKHKRHSPSPTPAHGNKPIPAPSSHMHAHAHMHHPAPLHQSRIPVTTASVVPASVNHVSTAPIAQPVVSLTRLPTSSTHIQPTAVWVKQELKTMTAVSSSHSTSASYQPHHHHYHHHVQPAQTVTSQTRDVGPVVKDFVPVVGSPEPPPYHQPPLPPHVNPFTFPTTGIKIHIPSGDGPSYSLTSQGNKDLKVFERAETKVFERTEAKVFEQTETKVFQQKDAQFAAAHKSLSDLTGLRQHQQLLEAMEGREEMPRLTPEGLIPPKSELPPKHGAFNHVGHQDGKEQLISPFNMRLQNLSNFPSMATQYRSAYRSHSVALQRAKAGSITSAAKSLDLLRQNLQKIINKELNGIVQKYVEKFFKPAADNIRLNNGVNSVSEEHINAVCRQIFEEGKRMYTTETRRSVTPIDFSDNVSESGSLNGKRVSPNPLCKRVKASDSDSEKGSDGGVPKKIPRRKGRPPLNSSGRSTPLKIVKPDNVKREGPKWDPDRIKPETLFVMGARANKALGLGNTRGRLYIRHPDVFKYSGDQEDKIWLHEQKLMPATGGKAYMLMVEDIVDLSKTEEYRDSPTLMMHECRGFEVPEWMRIKIKAQMQSMRSDLPKRSRSRSPLSERPEPPKSLPFSNFSDTASNNDIDSIGNKNSLQPSPADTEEMEFLSAVDNEDTQPSDISPFNVTGGFDDTPSRSPCALDSTDDDPSLTTPFA